MSDVPYSVQRFSHAVVNNFICVPPPTTYKQFQYDSIPVKHAGSCEPFVHVSIYDAMLMRHVILFSHQNIYVGHVILHMQSPILFNA